MVMHARKLPRISDGYYDKHQSQQYQNSKYSSSKSNYDEGYSMDRIRDSPNGNAYHRSVSPDSHSQSPRSYHTKNAYSQRHRDYRDRSRDDSRSPRDKYSRDGRSDQRSNYDRDREKVVSEGRKEERLTRFGSWSEHISSSGKKYYYNCKTEVSQWEKPREWLDTEHNRGERSSSHKIGSTFDRHSNCSSGSSTGRDRNSECQSHNSMSQNNVGMLGDRGDGRVSHSSRRRKSAEESQSQDMDISSGDSTPTSEKSHALSCDNHTAVSLSAVLPKLLSQPQTSHDLLSRTQQTTVPSSSTDSVLLESTDSVNTTGGPPTPTHSESQDAVDARKVASPTSSISSLQSLSQAAPLRSTVPALTPSLANHYRDDLIAHIRDWPAEQFERQCQKTSDEAHGLGSLALTRVSTELKMARSLVRLAEIQATLQEQRTLFLKQQSKELEEMKSQNSFMSDT